MLCFKCFITQKHSEHSQMFTCAEYFMHLTKYGKIHHFNTFAKIKNITEIPWSLSARAHTWTHQRYALQSSPNMLEKKKWLHHILCVNISHLDFLAHLVAEVAESPTNFRPSFSLSFALQGTWLILWNTEQHKGNFQRHNAHFYLYQQMLSCSLK